jgi:hypothetical protein
MNEEPGTSCVHVLFSCFFYEDVVTADVTAGVTLQACAFLKIVKYEYLRFALNWHLVYSP